MRCSAANGAMNFPKMMWLPHKVQGKDKDATDLICQPEVFGQSQYGNYAEGCTTLRAQGGDNGGGSENLVKENGRNLIRRLTLWNVSGSRASPMAGR